SLENTRLMTQTAGTWCLPVHPLSACAGLRLAVSVVVGKTRRRTVGAFGTPARGRTGLLRPPSRRPGRTAPAWHLRRLHEASRPVLPPQGNGPARALRAHYVQHPPDHLVDADAGGVDADGAFGRPQRRHRTVGIARVAGEDLA